MDSLLSRLLNIDPETVQKYHKSPFYTLLEHSVAGIVHFGIYNIRLSTNRYDEVPDLFLSQPKHIYRPAQQAELQGYIGADLKNNFDEDEYIQLGRFLYNQTPYLITFEELKHWAILQLLAQ